jgi:hypothetical protein
MTPFSSLYHLPYPYLQIHLLHASEELPALAVLYRHNRCWNGSNSKYYLINIRNAKRVLRLIIYVNGIPHYYVCVKKVTTIPYSIGYVPLEQVMTRNMAAANLVNKAGVVVSANTSSIEFAARDKGAVMHPTYNFAVIADASSPMAWPISGFTYFVIRRTHHIGDCARRQAAITFIYNYYTSPSTKMAANSVGFQAMPPYMTTNQIALLKDNVSAITYPLSFNQPYW